MTILPHLVKIVLLSGNFMLIRQGMQVQMVIHLKLLFRQECQELCIK